jgi:molybdopterin molybdotransferase
MSAMAGQARRNVEVGEAEALILAAMPRWPAERVPLADAVGSVLHEAIVAERDQPPFDRVAMDGIAVRGAAWTAGRRSFRVVGTQGAGAAALALGGDGECVEVMTGGVLPAGADTIIPVERLERRGDEAIVAADYAAKTGQSVHRRGSDHMRGEVLLEPGTVIGAPQAAILPIGGRADVAVTRSPRIGIVATGAIRPWPRHCNGTATPA